MPTPVIVGNWKMNTNLAGAVELAQEIAQGSAQVSGVELVLCPPVIFLAAVRGAVGLSPVKLGAQNMHYEESGAFTGEVSSSMLQGMCEYVILGHSERRQLFGETDELINRKVKAAMAAGFGPILCVGETLEQRDTGRAGQIIRAQLSRGLAGVDDITSLIVAYEPVWAVGTGQAANPEIAAEIMGGDILDELKNLYPTQAERAPLLYGGSVNPGNAAGFAAESCIHGALVGGASLSASQFLEIARLTAAAKG